MRIETEELKGRTQTELAELDQLRSRLELIHIEREFLHCFNRLQLRYSSSSENGVATVRPPNIDDTRRTGDGFACLGARRLTAG